MTEHVNVSDDDVISTDQVTSLVGYPTSKVGRVRKAVENVLTRDFDDWVEEGKECELLTTKGGGWVKGKFIIKFNVSFEFAPVQQPDTPPESTSPLDDLREQLSS